MAKHCTPHELGQLQDLQRRHDAAFAQLGMMARAYEKEKAALIRNIDMLEAGRQTLGERILAAHGIDPKDKGATHQIDHATGEIQVLKDGAYVPLDGAGNASPIIRPNGGG